MVAGLEQVRVFVVSASPYLRYVVSGELSSEPDLFVVGTAQTPDEIEYKQALLRPDLVVVDLESRRDLSNLERILEASQSPVLVVSSHAQEGAELAFAALEAGAADVVARCNGGLGEVVFLPDLLCKVRGLARVRSPAVGRKWASAQTRTKVSSRRFSQGDYLVAVSASCGAYGPLLGLLTAIPADLAAALLIMSSLPACYLPWFLRRVSPASTFHLLQAQVGQQLDVGVAYFVPPDCSLAAGPGGLVAPDSGANGSRVRSSVDETFSSLAKRYGSAVLAVIMSGVGCAGVQGALEVCAAGGSVIVQDTATCLAQETPQAVIDAGAATVVLSPERIADEIVRRVVDGQPAGGRV